MIKTDHFSASKSLYAIRLTSLLRTQVGRIESSSAPLYRYDIDAVWFKRRKGLDTANIGTLWAISADLHQDDHNPANAIKFLSETLTDGRYGGSCRSRWDGHRLWSTPNVEIELQRKDLRLLREMLEEFPEIPGGYDGWWAFK